MQIPEPQVEGSKQRSPTKPDEVEVGHSRLGGELIPGDDVKLDVADSLDDLDDGDDHDNDGRG